MSGPLVGKWPGWVDSYDGPSRTARVRIDGITDGSSALPEAVFEYPIGDRANASNSKDHSEIRVFPGDAVWLEFECGDERFPIITGYRTARTGNPTGWRRWGHQNIEITADNRMVFNAASVEWNVTGNVTENIGGSMNSTVGGDQHTDVSGTMGSTAATSSHSSATHALTAQVAINGALTTGSGPGGQGATLKGPLVIEGGTVTHDGKNIGKTHTHNEHNTVGGPTDPPN